jgi:hypothetical protein
VINGQRVARSMSAASPRGAASRGRPLTSEIAIACTDLPVRFQAPIALSEIGVQVLLFTFKFASGTPCVFLASASISGTFAFGAMISRLVLP